MIEKLLDIIFPKVCLNCGKQGEHYICSSCLHLYNSKINFKNENNKMYDYLIYLFKYESKNRRYMLDFKFNEKAYISEYFIKILTSNNKVNEFFKKFDFIIPVPTTKLKSSKRGYNQTELLADYFGKYLNIIVEKNVLIKSKENKTQSTLSKMDRKANVKDIFKIADADKVKNKNIILLDDIFTTGSTVEECSKILKKYGVKKICVVVICKGDIN